jgi:glucosamine-phosphate N-acetyltransferase
MESTHGIIIRKLQAKDLENGFLETMEGLAPVYMTPFKASKILKKRERMGIKTYVACLPGSEYVVGTASLIFQIKMFRGGGVVGIIEDVAVHPDHRGNYYGVKLLEYLVAAAKKAKCYKVILYCNEKNVSYYEKFGFHSHEVLMRVDFPENTSTINE